MEEHEVATQDGRVLKVLEDGDHMVRRVLVHNGMPNSRLLFAPDVRSAEATRDPPDSRMTDPATVARPGGRDAVWLTAPRMCAPSLGPWT